MARNIACADQGRPFLCFCPEQIDACAKDAITGGGQVVAENQSATIAPAHSTIELLDHMRGARTGPVPVSVMLKENMGYQVLSLGRSHLGRSGLLKVENLRLTLKKMLN